MDPTMEAKLEGNNRAALEVLDPSNNQVRVQRVPLSQEHLILSLFSVFTVLIQIVLAQTFSVLPHICRTFLIYLPQVVRREVTISILMKPEIACTKNVRLPLFLFNRTIACI